MRRALAALAVALILFALPAAAGDKREEALQILKWTGCQAQLVTNEGVPALQSHYSLWSHTVFLGTADYPGLIPDFEELILLHEIGHCLQAQEGVVLALGTVERELDADRRAADMLCARHKDGKRILHDIMVWAKRAFGYDGDPWHGTLAERIAQGENARLCMIQPPQAP